MALTFGTAVSGSWFTVDAIAHADTFQVNEVRIVGAEKAPTGQLRHLANVEPGTHLFRADLSAAIRGVEAHPWVEKASARRLFPGAVEIQVREHKPGLLLALNDLWMVSESGAVFKRAHSSALDYPVLTGLSPAMTEEHPRVARAIIDDALKVIKAVDGDEHIAINDLSEIHFDSTAGYSLVMRSGSRVVLGFADPYVALDRLSRMREQGLSLDTPQHVDLDVGTVAVVTLLQSPSQ